MSLLVTPRPRSPLSEAADDQRAPAKVTVTVIATPPQSVTLGPIGFALAWAGILALHAVSAAYLVVAGVLYTVLPATQVANMLELYQLSLNATHFPTLARVHYVLAAVHGYFLCKPFVRGAVTLLVPARVRTRLTGSLDALAQRTRSRSSSRSRARSPLRPWTQLLQTAAAVAVRLGRCVYHALFARDGLLGVHSAHFELLFLGREVVETILQTYQAYTMSRLLPRAKLNGFYTLVLVANCWTTPLLKRVCRGHRPLERLLVVLCDLVLDFVASIGVPVAVALSYLAQYEVATTDFAPWTLYYDDIWLLNFMNEAPIVLFGSWLDAASRLVFSLGLLSSMADVKALLTRSPTATVATATATIAVRRKSSRGTRVTHATTSSASLIKTTLSRPGLQRTIATWVHRALVLWGFGVAVLFVEAHVRAPPSHCALALRPWAVTLPACAVVTLDCRNDAVLSHGDIADWDLVFDQLDAASVEYVIVRHCPRVEVAPRIQTFRNLYGLKTYNSTVTSWGDDAAFTATAHPRVRFAFFVRTDFADAMLPRGLHDSHDFPPTLTDIEIAVSNLAHVPSTLPWPRTMTIFMESAQFDVFPMALAKLQPYHLSLAFNRIRSIPAEALMTSGIAKFTLRGNPIDALPDVGVDMTQLHDTGTGIFLFRLSLEYTNIARLPAWVTARFLEQVEIRAAQTPLCRDILLNESSVERTAWLDERPWLVHVQQSCVKDPGPYGLYPLDLETN